MSVLTMLYKSSKTAAFYTQQHSHGSSSDTFTIQSAYLKHLANGSISLTENHQSTDEKMSDNNFSCPNGIKLGLSWVPNCAVETTAVNIAAAVADKDKVLELLGALPSVAAAVDDGEGEQQITAASVLAAGESFTQLAFSTDGIHDTVGLHSRIGTCSDNDSGDFTASLLNRCLADTTCEKYEFGVDYGCLPDAALILEMGQDESKDAPNLEPADNKDSSNHTDVGSTGQVTKKDTTIPTASLLADNVNSDGKSLSLLSNGLLAPPVSETDTTTTSLVSSTNNNKDGDGNIVAIDAVSNANHVKRAAAVTPSSVHISKHGSHDMDVNLINSNKYIQNACSTQSRLTAQECLSSVAVGDLNIEAIESHLSPLHSTQDWPFNDCMTKSINAAHRPTICSISELNGVACTNLSTELLNNSIVLDKFVNRCDQIVLKNIEQDSNCDVVELKDLSLQILNEQDSPAVDSCSSKSNVANELTLFENVNKVNICDISDMELETGDDYKDNGMIKNQDFMQTVSVEKVSFKMEADSHSLLSSNRADKSQPLKITSAAKALGHVTEVEERLAAASDVGDKICKSNLILTNATDGSRLHGTAATTCSAAAVDIETSLTNQHRTGQLLHNLSENFNNSCDYEDDEDEQQSGGVSYSSVNEKKRVKFENSTSRDSGEQTRITEDTSRTLKEMLPGDFSTSGSALGFAIGGDPKMDAHVMSSHGDHSSSDSELEEQSEHDNMTKQNNISDDEEYESDVGDTTYLDKVPAIQEAGNLSEHHLDMDKTDADEDDYDSVGNFAEDDNESSIFDDEYVEDDDDLEGRSVRFDNDPETVQSDHKIETYSDLNDNLTSATGFTNPANAFPRTSSSFEQQLHSTDSHAQYAQFTDEPVDEDVDDLMYDDKYSKAALLRQRELEFFEQEEQEYKRQEEEFMRQHESKISNLVNSIGYDVPPTDEHVDSSDAPGLVCPPSNIKQSVDTVANDTTTVNFLSSVQGDDLELDDFINEEIASSLEGQSVISDNYSQISVTDECRRKASNSDLPAIEVSTSSAVDLNVEPNNDLTEKVIEFFAQVNEHIYLHNLFY